MPNDAPGGNCLQCLLQLGLAQEAVVSETATVLSNPADASPLLKPGSRIGRYKLLQQIGEGGYGVVYLAEQEEPVRRSVALKVIKLGMDTKQVIARFEAEQQALALMDHPNIAKVLDAGATDFGRPFFVMELVCGLKITDYCDQQKFSTRQRLELFIQVCQAIQHAHQKGIIHRDIKPSNVLVTEHAGVALPKVIDFGIAKATIGQRLTDKTLFTALEQFLGTPAYTSPEQAGMSGQDIDTRSDIYSLGILLYELLTGQTPFEVAKLQRLAMDEILRHIREKEPPRPSARLTTLTQQELTIVAQGRQIEPARLPNLLRGDLDWIIMKCLEKDRDRRYGTANGVAADLQRYLNDEPIVARPPGNLYRFQKMVRRNKKSFVAASAVIVAVLVGLGVSSWLFFKEKEARQRAVVAENAQSKLRAQAQADEQKAKTEAAKSRQVAHFLKEMLNGVGPSVALGRDTAMLREILDKTAERIGQELKQQPDVEADMKSTLGDVYFALGKYRIAEGMLREAVSARRKLLGNDNLDLAQSLDDLGVALEMQAKAEEAINVHREVLAIRLKLLGKEHRDVAKSLTHLGNDLSGARKYNEAESALRDAVTLQRKILGDGEQLDLAQSLGIFAGVLSKNGKHDEAEAVARESLAIRRKLLGNEHPEVAVSLQSLGNVFLRQRMFSEAEKFYRESLELRRKLLGEAHPLVGQSLSSLVALLKQQGRLDEAITVYRKAANEGNIYAQGHLGMMYLNGVGDKINQVEAVNWLQKAANQGDTYAQGHLGQIYAQGNGVAADPVEAVKWYRKAANQDDIFAEGRLGWMYLEGHGVTKDPVEAGKWFRKGADQGDAYAQGRLGWLYANGQGLAQDPVAALNWLHKAADQCDTLAQIDLALIYQNGMGVAKDPVEAIKWFRKAAEQGSTEARGRLGRIYAGGEGVPKDIVEATKWYRKVADHYRKAAEPGDAQAWNTLARFLATCEIAELRDGTAALSFAEKAVAATNRKDPTNLSTLAMAYAETGQFNKAILVEHEAIALEPDEEQKKDSFSRLKLYESGLPFHAPFP